jgi:hypothetical protein
MNNLKNTSLNVHVITTYHSSQNMYTKTSDGKK